MWKTRHSAAARQVKKSFSETVFNVPFRALNCELMQSHRLKIFATAVGSVHKSAALLCP
jgi:ligand-binding SRPBCC domain-containing protein